MTIQEAKQVLKAKHADFKHVPCDRCKGGKYWQGRGHYRDVCFKCGDEGVYSRSLVIKRNKAIKLLENAIDKVEVVSGVQLKKCYAEVVVTMANGNTYTHPIKFVAAKRRDMDAAPRVAARAQRFADKVEAAGKINPAIWNAAAPEVRDENGRIKKVIVD